MCAPLHPRHFFSEMEIKHKIQAYCVCGIVCPWVADGGDGLQIRRVAANVTTKQSRTAYKGWSPVWGLGEGVSPHRKKCSVLRNVTQGLGRIWILCSGQGPVADSSQHRNESSGSIKGGEFFD